MINKYNEKYSEAINETIFKECMALREEGQYVVGTYCAFTPKELIVAGGGIPVSLCAGSYESSKKAEVHLPRNLCDLIKSSYGHGIANTCPYFHYSDYIIADATCDGKKKMFELLADIKPIHVLDLPASYTRERDYDFFENELLAIKNYLEKANDCKITVETLNAAIKDYNDLRRALNKLHRLNNGEIPIVEGREIRAIASISFECNLQKRVEEIEAVIKELEKRRDDAEFLEVMKRKPRILLTGCPTTHDKLINAIEENGALIVAMENCGGLKTLGTFVEENTSNPLRALSEKYLSVACPCMSPNTDRFELLGQLIEEFNIDGVIELTWHSCHTYNVEANLIGKYVRAKGVPYLQVTTDYSMGDMGQISTRVQAFLELI